MSVAPPATAQLTLFLVQVTFLLGLGLMLGRLAARFGLPALVGELCAGMLLGPSLLAWLAPWPTPCPRSC
jgi:Kef-type K+ transport system membrane component KefB